MNTALVSNVSLIQQGVAPLTGSLVRCPLCRGRGTVERHDDEGSWIDMCLACPVAGVIALPVEPETRDALGEELMLASGLEWDGIEDADRVTIRLRLAVARSRRAA
jgi:hypothetical protein